MTAFLSLLFFLLASGSLARVYITQPFAETVWCAGKPAEMTWIDNGDLPHIWDSKMKGKAVGDLYCFEGPEKEIYIASIPIKSLKDGHAMFTLPDACSLTYCSHNYNYEMRIISNDLISYSHSFTITNTECSSRSSSSESTDHLPSKNSKAFAEQDIDGESPDTPTSPSESLSSTSSSNVTSSSSKSVPQTTTVSASNTMHSMQQSIASTIYADPLQTPGQQASFGIQGHRNAASSRFKMNSRWMDFEKIKFRLIFIVWPALVGISMAM